MNKKFSTLALGLLLSAFGVNAAETSITIADAVKTAGDCFYLKSGSNYLAITKTADEKADSIIYESDVTKAPMWTIVKSDYSADQKQLYKITSKTGVALSFKKDKNATPKVMDGVNQWLLIGDETNGYTIKTAVSASESLALGGTTDLAVKSGTSAAAFQIIDAGTKVLKANEISTFSVFELLASEALEGNPFKDTEIKATQVEGSEFVTFAVVGKKDFFIGLDTARTVIHNQVNEFGVKLVADSTYEASTIHSVSNADLQQFKVVRTLKNDKLTLYVKDSPTFGTDGKFAKALKGENVKLVYAQVGTSKVLTVSSLKADGISQNYGNSLTFTQKVGTPASLPNGAGVYFLKDKNTHNANGTAKNENYNKYYGALVSANHRLDAVSNFKREGQYMVAEKDGKYAVVSRCQGKDPDIEYYTLNEKATGKNAVYDEIYKVSDNVFTFNGKDTIEFIYSKEVTEAKDRYLGYKHFTPEEIGNEAFALNLISKTPGVENLYAYAKDSLICIQSTGIENATLFKLVPNSNSAAYDTGGAQSLKDTLSMASYLLKEQYGDKYLTSDMSVWHWDEDVEDFYIAPGDYGQLKYTKTIYSEPSEGAAYRGANWFTFVAEAEGEYLMTTNSYRMSFNVKTAALEYLRKSSDEVVNYFNLVAAPAPTYANLGDAHHMMLSSSEGDGKALSMNPATLFAEVKTAEQTPYIDSLFGLWIDTACVKDIAKPLYYVTTGNGLSAADREAGYMNYLVNPYDSVFVAGENGWEEAKEASKYTFKDHEYMSYAKAAFVKAKVYGADSLTIAREKPTAADTLKDMSINPAAMAFMTTAATDGTTNLIVENTIKAFNGQNDEEEQQFYNRSYFLKVINNVLVWSPAKDDAHLFNVATTELHPTSNDNVAEGTSAIIVIGEVGKVSIQGAAGKSVVITNILGKVVAETVLTSDNATIAVPAGIVAVAVDGEEAVKVVVK